jgi:hypothetical protein
MEANLDRNEIINKQSSDELFGDNLLQAEYSINNELRAKSRNAFENFHESTVLNRPMTPVHLRQSIMLQTRPFDTNEIGELKNNRQAINNFKSDLNNIKKSTNILVINSEDMSGEENYTKQSQLQTASLPPPGNAGFVSRPKIQRTPDPSVAMKTTKYDSINTINSSIQSASSSQQSTGHSFLPKYSITEPRPSSATNTAKSTCKSPTQSNASTLK